MIVVDLICEHGHAFEGWFAHSDDIESQQARGLLVCAICASHNMRRLPSAPHVRRSESGSHEEAKDAQAQGGEARESAGETGHAQKLLQLLTSKLQEAVAQSEDVGEDFPSEARKIHFGDAQERAIRGVASSKEVASLLDEGISVLPLPIAKEDLH
jgi:hypothetical protein